MKKIILTFVLFLNCLAMPVWAASFVVQKIDIQGLERITPETVKSYIPIKPGDRLNTDKTAAIIKALYKTGFFDHITLRRLNNTLVIVVVERATIGELKISGNNAIPTDKLTTVMKGLDIAEGRVYNRAVLDRIKQGLLNQYYELGRYNARIDVKVTPMSRGRVLVKIDISEGLIAKIRRINVIGNHVFSEAQLTRQLTVSTSGLITFLTQTDQYSQEKLESSIEAIRNFYLDRGYVKFSVLSSQVSITPDRKSVYITIVIKEGEPYKVKGFALMGDFVIPRQELMPLVKLQMGGVFSRQAVVDSEKAISDAYGNKGYVYATISLNPNIDDRTKQVFLTFTIKSGKRTYVRHIYFTDNAKTNDETLRREVEQMEGSVVSTAKLEESKRRLNLLPYLRETEMSILPVHQSDDQVDVNYKVKEQNVAELTGRVGYSQLEHVILGAGVNQKNFLGTGETLGFNFQHSRYLQQYDVNFTDPYYTPSGISRSINLAVSRYNPGNANLSSSYTANEYDLSVLYSIPIGHEKNVFNRVQLGYGYQNTLVNLQSGPSMEVQNFVNKHGRHFQQLDLVAGISRDSRNKAIFPTKGMLQSLGLDIFLPVATESLHYYTLNYMNTWYQPLAKDFVLTTRGALAYGNSFSGGAANYPFFKNFYAGGPGSVRGYAGNTLGPKDSNYKASGGNFLADGSVGLIFPNYISDNLRTTVFLDAGNVYKTYNNQSVNGTSSGPLRFAIGIDAQMFLPFLGTPVDVSLAKAVHPRRTGNPSLRDDLEIFQFSLGANFG